MAELHAVRLERGGPWAWARDLREQDGWDAHARFMDSLVDEGFVVLGGPLEGGRDVLLAVAAPSEQAIRERLAGDPWHTNGMLTVARVERWTILLDGCNRQAVSHRVAAARRGRPSGRDGAACRG
jgi:uncharacterized protein YciI